MCRIKLVTLDVTNTLLKLRQEPGRVYAQAARPLGLRASPDQLSADFRAHYRAMWRRHPNFGRAAVGWREWWRQVVRGTLRDHVRDPAALDEVAARLVEDYARGSSWRVADGGAELLRCLAARGVSLGVVSNFDPRVHDILAELGLRGYFRFVVTSYEAGYCKPDARIFEEALAGAGGGVSPRCALHVGDDARRDYGGARRAGWHALLLGARADTPPRVHPSHVYEDLVSLKNDIVRNKTPFSFVEAADCNDL